MESILSSDDRREEFIACVPGMIPGKKGEGYLLITNKRMLFMADTNDSEEYDNMLDEIKDDLINDLFDGIQEDRCTFIYPMRAVHSIQTSGYLVSWENQIFFYDNSSVTVEMDVKADQKFFTESIQKAIPGLLFLPALTTGEYAPNIGRYDPRNPFGARYNPDYPHGYVVANTKGIKKNPHVLDAAIEAAKKDGTLPADWILEVKDMSKEYPPPGVPMVYDAFFN